MKGENCNVKKGAKRMMKTELPEGMEQSCNVKKGAKP